MSNTTAGLAGEQEIIARVKCPNCGKELMQLPPNQILYDVKCSVCDFRAQIKTNHTKPRAEVFGAGWKAMNINLKGGHLVPPLIVNFKWKEKGTLHQQIRFYPFIPRAYLRRYKLKADGGKSPRFNYIHLDKLPHFILLDK